MTISSILTMSTKRIRRKVWASVFLSQCNDILYLHYGATDPLGRLWQPTVVELKAQDWELYPA